MSDRPMYHEGMRALQDAFDSRRVADRLEQVTLRRAFDDGHRKLIARQSHFFLATADADGWPDCSFKGGAPGFVRVVDDRTLAFPGYDGNGMFRSLGNLRVNPRVGMLFIDFEAQRRLRVNGTANLHLDDPLRAEYPGAQLIVRVTAEAIFPNCPRYIPRLQLLEPSPYVPRKGYEPPVPAWKQWPEIRDTLPADDPARGGAAPDRPE